MRRALELARRGWGRVHPNPMVGAVVLAGGEIAGEGFHAEFGGPHAEAAALAGAGDRARGATLVATLEPCGHCGKQPACVDLVAASGIARVVVGSRDPNPVAAGGIDRLRSLGIEVELGVLQEEAERLNGPWLHGFRDRRRPFVAVKLATSLDHRIADAAGHSRWISGDEARDWVHWFRAGFGAIGVGGRTAQVDDPMLTVRGSLEPRRPPVRVVFLGRHRIRAEQSLVRTARDFPTIGVGGELAGVEAAALTEAGVELLPAPDLATGLALLRAKGIDSIVIEGGGRLAGALLGAGLVDRLAWIVSPVWLGDHGIPATRGFEVPSLLHAERWRVVERQPLGEDTLLVFDRR